MIDIHISNESMWIIVIAVLGRDFVQIQPIMREIKEPWKSRVITGLYSFEGYTKAIHIVCMLYCLSLILLFHSFLFI